jgi:tRNA modification GTPase
VLNGKIDLLQAEAISDLIDSKMAGGARAAWRQLQGALSEDLEEIRERLLATLADIEAAVDFTDDELPESDFAMRKAGICAVQEKLASLLGGFAASRRQRDGIRVVFTGRPNAGKSSLVNRLLGSGRMIVSDEPGTTRDIVEEAVELEGIAFVLTDTAGIRETTGKAESQAVERARETLGEADLCVVVIDASDPAEHDARLPEGVAASDAIVVWNKTDLAAPGFRPMLRPDGATSVSTSALTGEGCDTLASCLVDAARQRLETGPAGISRVRHRAALERAAVALARASELAVREDATELAAAELRTAVAELAAISSPVDNEDVLDRIFSEFCIGK